ncbi:MAG TPA: CARDB domain-containing protein, partial [Pedococcus sp.]|nr:CARDB domain-containing protein [Pedococcus sp.]
DFIDATVDSTGRVEVGYADGCTGPCAQPGGAQNFDAYATVARQQSGNTLYAAFDALPNLTPTSLSVTKAGGLYATTTTVANTGKAPAGGVITRLLVNGIVVATSSSPVDIAAGRSSVVSFPGLRLGKGTHTVEVVVDPDGRIKESNEADNQRQAQVNR